MTVNYTVMHCNTLRYTVEYTETHSRSVKKTRPNNVASWYVIRLLSPEHIATKKVLQKRNINADNNINI